MLRYPPYLMAQSLGSYVETTLDVVDCRFAERELAPSPFRLIISEC